MKNNRPVFQQDAFVKGNREDNSDPPDMKIGHMMSIWWCYNLAVKWTLKEFMFLEPPPPPAFSFPFWVYFFVHFLEVIKSQYFTPDVIWDIYSNICHCWLPAVFMWHLCGDKGSYSVALCTYILNKIFHKQKLINQIDFKMGMLYTDR